METIEVSQNLAEMAPHIYHAQRAPKSQKFIEIYGDSMETIEVSQNGLISICTMVSEPQNQ